jgi:CBS domain containing-hemolysin-like protein
MAESDETAESRSQSRAGLIDRIARAFRGPEKDESASDTPAQAQARTDLRVKSEAFSTARVEAVMVPRAEIVAVEINTPFGELLETLATAQHSRLPVYRSTLDDPVGLVHLKDVVTQIALRRRDGGRIDSDERLLPRILRQVLYAPASMRLPDLLLKMQASRIHMALVIDEYGGTDGLVSLEDLVEQIVGDIEDEHDTDSDGIIERGPGLWEADGPVLVADFAERSGVDLSLEDWEDEVDSLAGLMVALAGRVPQRGEIVPHPSGSDLEVLDADARRIKKLRIRVGARASEPKAGT